MEKSTILTADILDIIFDGRNKAYGAYELRATYRKRLALSVSVMLAAVLVFVGLAFTGKEKDKDSNVIVAPDTHLVDVAPPEKKIELPPPPKQTPPPVQLEMKKFTAYQVVKDELVPEDEKPPVNDDLENVKIGNVNQEGVKGDDVVAPPNEGTGQKVIEAPKRNDEDDNGIFLSVQIESEFPGGTAAWQRFLHKYLVYPQQAIDDGVQGFVTVQFVVDKEGNVADVQAISGPEELRAEAVRVIKKSGKWTPAVQNGKKVRSYKRQPIGFQLPEE